MIFFIISLAPRAGKMNEIARCDWLPERARWSDLAHSGLPAEPTKLPQKPYNKSFIDQVCSVKMAGYWPRSFFGSLWTSTLSQSINTEKKNLAILTHPAILTSYLVNNPYILTSHLVSNPYILTSHLVNNPYILTSYLVNNPYILTSHLVNNPYLLALCQRKMR